MSVRDELRDILEAYLEISLRKMILRKRVEKIRDKMIERLRGIKDPEAEKLIRRIERDKSLRTIIAVLDKYESLVRKQ